MNNNFKVKALASDGSWFNEGDILEFINGRCIFKNGNESSCYNDFEDFIHCNDYWINYFILLQEDNTYKEFTKQDLKTGMVVELRNGGIYYVLGDKIIGKYGFNIINDSNYLDNMLTRNISDNEWNIVAVYSISSNCYNLDCILDKAYLNLIWERKEEPQPKEMTVEEIEKELGYSIKVVK